MDQNAHQLFFGSLGAIEVHVKGLVRGFLLLFLNEKELAALEGALIVLLYDYAVGLAATRIQWDLVLCKQIMGEVFLQSLSFNAQSRIAKHNDCEIFYLPN